MPTPNAIVIPSGGLPNTYPTVFVSTLAELSGSLTSLDGVGGIICLKSDITVTSALDVPGGVLITGRYGAQKLLIDTGGSITLSAQAELRDLTLVGVKSSGNLVEMPEARALVTHCFFQVDNADAVTCVYVTGSYNRILGCSFFGVVGPGSAVGIDYAAGLENLDRDSLFA